MSLNSYAAPAGEFLFVGGSYDGQRMWVGLPYDAINLNVRVPSGVLHCDAPDQPKQVMSEEYLLSKLASQSSTFFVYRSSSLTNDDLMEALLRRYKPAQEPEV